MLNCKKYRKVNGLTFGRSGYNNFIGSPQGCFQGWHKISPGIRAIGHGVIVQTQIKVSHMAGQNEEKKEKEKGNSRGIYNASY